LKLGLRDSLLGMSEGRVNLLNGLLLSSPHIRLGEVLIVRIYLIKGWVELLRRILKHRLLVIRLHSRIKVVQ